MSLNKINRVWTGDLKIGKEISGKDEIGELEVDFYRMVEKTDTLINEVYQALTTRLLPGLTEKAICHLYSDWITIWRTPGVHLLI